RVQAQVTDYGAKFDPRTAPNIDESAAVGDRRIGGLGLLLTHRGAGGLGYEGEGDRHRTTFWVRRSPAGWGGGGGGPGVVRRGGGVVVPPRGRLNGSTSQAFATRLEPLTESPEPRLVADSPGIAFVSSAGLRVFLSFLKRVKAAHGMFAPCVVQPPIREVLDI